MQMQEIKKDLDLSDKIDFNKLCECLQKIEESGNVTDKKKILQKYLNWWKDFTKSTMKESGKNCGASFYCILRILIPSADKERNCTITTKALGKIYIQFLGLAAEGQDGSKLLNKNVGSDDFAEVVYKIMKKKSNSSLSNIKISAIHCLLDTIANDNRKNAEEKLIKFINEATPLEQKWLLRIILKNLNLGIVNRTIFNIFHPAGYQLYLRSSNLKTLCQIIESGQEINFEQSVQLFNHIKPMLCKLLEISEKEKIFEKTGYFLETKMDGERFQIHIENKTFKYFSRNGFNYTSNFRENLTPFLSKLFKLKVENIIIDGEMMVWDKSKASFRVKGENFLVRNLRTENNLRPCFVVYDLLYLNNTSMLNRPYYERINILNTLFNEETGIFHYSKRIKISNYDEFIGHFVDVVNKCEEGVVIKEENSIYEPGSRSNGWYKLKPDYVEGIISDFDLIILGGYCGTNTEYINKYLLGVSKKCDLTHEIIYKTVCTVSSGLTLKEKSQLNSSLKSHWKKNVSANVEYGKEIPNVWIEPKNSCILQVKASELCNSFSYATKYTLRFPRIVCIRNDKIYSECMTLDEFDSFIKSNSKVQKIHKHDLATTDIIKRKMPKLPYINPYKSKLRTHEIANVSDLFKNLEFYIVNASSIESMENLKQIIMKHSGKIIATPSLDTNKCICIASKISFRVKNLIQTKSYNIVNSNWLKRYFSDDKITNNVIKFKLSDVIYATPSFEQKLKSIFDNNGDSYQDHVNQEELQLILNDLNSNNITPLEYTDIYNFEKKLYNKSISPNIFRGVYGFFLDQNEFSCTTAKLIFAARGGKILNNIDDAESFQKPLLIFFNNRSSITNFESPYKFEKTTCIFISCSWIFECNKSDKKLIYTSYEIDA